MSKIYEVVYIDKFSDIARAELARASLKKRFGLSGRMISALGSGVPVVVKKDIPLDEAQRFENAIKGAGGVCWIQERSPDYKHYERRQVDRRQIMDRRDSYRGSSILPDRRMGLGRRSEDQQH